MRYGPGETEESTNDHVAALKQECLKRQPNLNAIDRRMDATKVIRRHQLRELDMADILELYPPLRESTQVKYSNSVPDLYFLQLVIQFMVLITIPFLFIPQWLLETERQFSVNLVENLENFFSTKRSETALSQLQAIPKAVTTCKAFLDVGGDSEYQLYKLQYF